MKKICPLLGCQYRIEPAILRGGSDYIVANTIPCIGKSCICYKEDLGDGYCDFFKEYVGKEKEGDEE